MLHPPGFMDSLNHTLIHSHHHLGLLCDTELSKRDNVETIKAGGGFHHGRHIRPERTTLTDDVHDKKNPRLVSSNGPLRMASSKMKIDETMASCTMESWPPNLDALFYVSQECRADKNGERAIRAHLYACSIGMETHTMLGNFLVPMFVDCGCFVEAKRVLNKLFIRNEFSWTSVIQGCNEWGESYHAFVLLERMQDDLVQPTVFTFVALLKACAKMKNIQKGQKLHLEIIKHSYEKDAHIGNILIDMYAKCGLFAEAMYSFRSIPNRDVVSWNTLIGGYVDHGFEKEALELLDEMQETEMYPNHVTFICGLKACGNTRALGKGQALHAEIASEGYDGGFKNVESTLIDMYVKCGSVCEARDVFDNLNDRDAVTWNALIVGYAEHGLGNEALHLFEKMKTHDISPDAVTLAYCIKAAGNIGDMGKGHVIHMESVRCGLETDDLIQSTLVDMYANLGWVEEAEEVFNKMPSRGVVPWTALIVGYVNCGHGEEALNCFRNMQSEGIPANDVTLVCGLKACSGLENTQMGRELHMLATKEGYEKAPFVGTAIVDMYAKCGFLEEAHESLLNLPTPGVIAWTALISGYVKGGVGEEALHTLKQMQKEGVAPNEVTFACCLKACGTLQAIDLGQSLHASIITEGFEEDPYVGSFLVDMYAKCGFVKEAREVFDNLQSRDLATWNTLMTGYIDHEFLDEALICFERMQLEGIASNSVTFALALKTCSSLRSINRGQEIVTQITAEGLDKDIFICNALVDFYAKCGCLMDARDAFEKLPFRDVISWTSLITGYVDYGMGEAALSCYVQMKSECLQPDSGTFVCCLKACGSVGYLQKGQEIHVEVVIEGLENDFLVGNSLVDMYAKCGWLVEAQEIFDELPKQDVVSWTALIGGYAEHGHHAEALSCFQEMQLKGISPDEVSWNNLILGYSGQGNCESAHKSYAQMQEQGFLPNKVTITNHLKACGTTADLKIGQRLVTQIYGEAGVDSVEIIMANAIVDMYGRCGSMGDARKAFNEMRRRERVTWNCLIAGYARQGECETVFELFATMVLEERVQPNEVTFLAVLIACNHAGLVQKGKMYFNMMLEDYGLEQTIMHYNCMIDLFGRAGLLDDLVMLLHSMPLEPNDVTWITVLSASQKWSNMTLGRHAFEQLMSGSERNTAAFVTMANIYANGHMWDQAKKIEVMTLWRELCPEIS